MDISNKALALVLVVATSISLFGTILTLQRMDGIGAYGSGRAVTNATDTGSTNFSINSSLSIVFIVKNVDFGSGLVNATGAHNCTLNTSTAMTPNTDCIGFNNNIAPLVIQNQGTQNVTLNMSFNSNASSFIGGTSPSFTFRASANDTTPCPGGSFNTAQTEVPAVNTNVSICSGTKFNWQSGSRTIDIDLGLRIPQDAAAGSRTVQITAYGSSP